MTRPTHPRLVASGASTEDGGVDPLERRVPPRAASGPEETAPDELGRPEGDVLVEPDVPWIVLVWNDPINLMSYVTHVLQTVFGYSLEKATRLMLDVHLKGRAVVANGTREECERHVFRLHEHGLWATMQKDT